MDTSLNRSARRGKPGNIGIAFDALSYAGVLSVTLVTDPDIVADPDQLSSLPPRGVRRTSPVDRGRSGETPQGPDDPLRPLPERPCGWAIRWCRWRRPRLVFPDSSAGGTCAGMPAARSRLKITCAAEPSRRERRCRAFAGDGADGKPGCGCAERRLERDAVRECACEPGRGGECGAHGYPPNPPVDTLRLGLRGPVRRRGCDAH